MSNVNATFLISLLIILLGYLLKRQQVIKETEGKVLSKAIFYVTFPAIILHTVPSLEITSSLLYLPVIPLAFGLLVFIISFQLFKQKPAPLKGVILMATIGFNIGLFAYPIIEAIWGKEGLLYIAMFDMGNALLVLGLSYGAGAAYAPKKPAKEKTGIAYVFKMLIRSVPLLCYLFALLLNILDIPLPTLASSLIGTVAQANRTLVLLLLGIYLRFQFEQTILKPVVLVLLMRYSFGLLTGIILYNILPFPHLYRTIILVGLLLPVGLTIIPFSDEFGYEPTFAGAIATLSIIISFTLIWGLIIAFDLA